MPKLLLTLLALSWIPFIAACSGTSKDQAYRPYFDARFDLTGRGDIRLLSGAEPRWFVSDVNGAFEIKDMSLSIAAVLGEKGAILPGEASVLSIVMTDNGESSVLAIEDRTVALKVQIAADGTVQKAYFGGSYDSLLALGKTIEPDTFMKGSVWIMYQDAVFASGQLDLEFFSHRIAGSFRVLKSRR
jgi:hypothetical protein